MSCCPVRGVQATQPSIAQTRSGIARLEAQRSVQQPGRRTLPILLKHSHFSHAPRAIWQKIVKCPARFCKVIPCRGAHPITCILKRTHISATDRTRSRKSKRSSGRAVRRPGEGSDAAHARGGARGRGAGREPSAGRRWCGSVTNFPRRVRYRRVILLKFEGGQRGPNARARPFAPGPCSHARWHARSASD